MEKKLFRLPVLSMVVLILLMISPTMACPPQGTKCEDCVLDQIKYGCQSCVPMLRCMARCLWNGVSRAECNKKCDCNGGKPTLSDCKKCMSRCKCSCAAAAAA
ncbi:uncharacterized protein LOC110623733 [Manihot esculenta]|uniref:Uncharacterized protein n=1 Tax=Manihot esculenta TaxID=3983 RepID=A0A2C9VAS7_MANES|nr:uncharacterized protein LOC110623733 [Manihot esculenta]OAY41050.1 hypothetical protein MANES_09G070200v8 [Manihot esculenta]